MKVNSLLCIDLKTKLQDEVLLKPGKEYPGVLRREKPTEDYGFDDCHYTFIETLCPTTGKRNPHLFIGEYITITRRDDGTIRLNFRPMKGSEDFNIDAYVLNLCDELRRALKGLIEE